MLKYNTIIFSKNNLEFSLKLYLSVQDDLKFGYIEKNKYYELAERNGFRQILNNDYGAVQGINEEKPHLLTPSDTTVMKENFYLLAREIFYSQDKRTHIKIINYNNELLGESDIVLEVIESINSSAWNFKKVYIKFLEQVITSIIKFKYYFYHDTMKVKCIGTGEFYEGDVMNVYKLGKFCRKTNIAIPEFQEEYRKKIEKENIKEIEGKFLVAVSLLEGGE